VFNEFFPVSVLVNTPPNIANSTELNLFNSMVGELEELPESYGPNRTLLWLRPYLDFDREISKLWGLVGFEQAYSPSLDNLEFFLDQIGHPPTIKFGGDGANGTKRLRGFTFTIIARNMAEWSNRASLEEKCREILVKYNFNATIHDGDSAVLNMLLTVKIDLIGSITATIVCMVVICSFFIPSQVRFSSTQRIYTLYGYIIPSHEHLRWASL